LWNLIAPYDEILYIIYEYLVLTPQRIRCASTEKSSQLMVCGEIVPDCCENQTKTINTLCGHNAEFIVLNW